MLDEAACERRVYRLATLLTGRPSAATETLASVVAGARALRDMDGAHLDRLTVLRCREMAAGVLAVGAVPLAIAEALAALPGQQREAWVLARVFRTLLRETARAMDCSVTATKLHLAQADAAMNAIAPDGLSASHALLAYTATLEVPEFYRESRRRRLRRRRMATAGAIMVIVAAVFIAFMLF